MKSSDLRLAYHVLGLLMAPVALSAPLNLRLVDAQGQPVPGTVVTLRSTDAARGRAPPIDAVMDQVDLQFVPHVLVVPAGSKVSFPNSDRTSHQVYSFSAVRRFQLPLYSGEPYPPVEFSIPGVATLGCNIHDQMRAYVFVVDAQYYGRTDAAGQWHGPEVVPGEYIVQIWHPLSRNSKPIIDQTVTIGPSAPAMTLRLSASLKLRPAAKVPANWDVY